MVIKFLSLFIICVYQFHLSKSLPPIPLLAENDSNITTVHVQLVSPLESLVDHVVFDSGVKLKDSTEDPDDNKTLSNIYHLGTWGIAGGGVSYPYQNYLGLSVPSSYKIISNVAYGSDPKQKLDIYLPPDRNPLKTRVILTIHGGGWSGGKKEDFNLFPVFFSYTLPQHAIVNLGYRLGTPDAPGYPKQIEDIKKAISFLKSKAVEYSFDPKFALVGASTGAYLSMLYGYNYDWAKDVKVIGNIAGPSSLVDPSYTDNKNYERLFYPFVGKYSFAEHPRLYESTCPVNFVSGQSPKTISFYGDKDPLVPNTQGALLEEKLDNVGVYNKYYLYPGGGHGVFSLEQYGHLFGKIKQFIKNFL